MLRFLPPKNEVAKGGKACLSSWSLILRKSKSNFFSCLKPLLRFGFLQKEIPLKRGISRIEFQFFLLSISLNKFPSLFPRKTSERRNHDCFCLIKTKVSSSFALQKQSIENDSKKAPHSVWSFEGAEWNVESELFYFDS